MDNAKYLFEYVHYHTDKKAIWISKNTDVVSQLTEQGFSAFHEYTDDAKYYSRYASVAIITHRGNRKNSDLPFQYFSKKTKVVQLWHGIPLKKIAYDDNIFSFKHDESSLRYKIKRAIKHTFFPFLNYVNKPSMILALSKETKEIFSQAFRIPLENVKITGYPRNDTLLKNKSTTTFSEKKKVIYMPTFRGSVNSDFDLFLQYGFNVEKLNMFLSEEGFTLDIKLHPFNQPSEDLMQQLYHASNISFLDYDAIYEIINEYDVLITDYSSIFFDYLLLDRPIIFAPFDKEVYIEEDREFYFEYDEVTPGPKAMNWDEVMTHLQKFNIAPQLYDKERQLIKNKFHTYQDDKSTQRVYEAILNIINEK